MKTMQLINFIAGHPEYKNIVIKDEGDRTRIQAVARLSSGYEEEKDTEWSLNGTLEKETLLVYSNQY